MARKIIVQWIKKYNLVLLLVSSHWYIKTFDSFMPKNCFKLLLCTPANKLYKPLLLTKYVSY